MKLAKKIRVEIKSFRVLLFCENLCGVLTKLEILIKMFHVFLLVLCSLGLPKVGDPFPPLEGKLP